MWLDRQFGDDSDVGDKWIPNTYMLAIRGQIALSYGRERCSL
jgi:hypothetical protein